VELNRTNEGTKERLGAEEAVEGAGNTRAAHDTTSAAEKCNHFPIARQNSLVSTGLAG